MKFKIKTVKGRLKGIKTKNYVDYCVILDKTHVTKNNNHTGEPVNSRKRVGPTGIVRSEKLLQAVIMSELRNSIRAMSRPHCKICTTVSTALCTVSNEQVAAAVASGIPCSRTVAWVITPDRMTKH